MPDIIPVVYEDNYAYLYPTSPGQCLVVDPGETAPILSAVKDTGLVPVAVFLTHNHGDHNGGVSGLLKEYPDIPVYATGGHGPTIVDDNTTLPDMDAQVMTTPGHSNDSACLLTPSGLFTGDTLFGAGCGRVFTGNYKTMFASLEKIAGLPVETPLYFGHEYTLDNLNLLL